MPAPKARKYIAYRFPERLIKNMEEGRTDCAYNMLGQATGYQYPQTKRYRCYWDQDRLHDLESDPGEQENLADDPEHAAILAEGKKRLRRYLDRFEHPFDLTEQPFLKTDRFRELAARTTEDVEYIKKAEYYRKGAW